MWNVLYTLKYWDTPLNFWIQVLTIHHLNMHLQTFVKELVFPKTSLNSSVVLSINVFPTRVKAFGIQSGRPCKVSERGHWVMKRIVDKSRHHSADSAATDLLWHYDQHKSCAFGASWHRFLWLSSSCSVMCKWPSIFVHIQHLCMFRFCKLLACAHSIK